MRELAPDIVLLDIATADTLEVDELRAASCTTKVLALGIPEVEAAIVRCAQAGFSGYVPPDASANELLKAIQTAAKNELHCSPKAAACLFRRLGHTAEPAKRALRSPLTEREIEVLRLVQQGLSNKVIARNLCIELQTVKNHIHRILSKLGVQNRAAAAACFEELWQAFSRATNGQDEQPRGDC